MDTAEPEQIAVLEMTDAAGSAFTIIVTESDLAQPFELTSVKV